MAARRKRTHTLGLPVCVLQASQEQTEARHARLRPRDERGERAATKRREKIPTVGRRCHWLGPDRFDTPAHALRQSVT